jgi:hypothetical protein
LAFLEISKDTALEVAGPGAVWPDLPMTREEIAKDLILEIKAGSSGAPNKAQELANLERGMPYLIQLPGMNPTTLARRYAGLLDLDIDELIVEGLPSITAANSMAGKAPGTGDPSTDPNAQGAEGSENAPNPQENEPGPQPKMPALSVYDASGNPML